MRMTVRWPAVVSCALCLMLGCGKPAPEGEPASVTLESGALAPMAGTNLRVDRSTPTVTAAAFVTGFSAEAVGAGTAPWRSDLRLTNATRLLFASSEAPEVRFPAGFALPLDQILSDMPEAWRGARLVSSAAEGVEKVRWRVDVLPKSTAGLKRLYPLELAISLNEMQVDLPAPGWWSIGLPGSEQALAPGHKLYRGKVAGVTKDATVHAATAYGGAYLSSIRFQDATEKKTLWEAARGGAAGRIEPYRSENGFVLLRDHEYEIEAAFDVPEGSQALGAAVVFLYYRLPDDQSVSYPFPPADE